jgi:hypothetical protein
MANRIHVVQVKQVMQVWRRRKMGGFPVSPRLTPRTQRETGEIQRNQRRLTRLTCLIPTSRQQTVMPAASRPAFLGLSSEIVQEI